MYAKAFQRIWVYTVKEQVHYMLYVNQSNQYKNERDNLKQSYNQYINHLQLMGEILL